MTPPIARTAEEASALADQIKTAIRNYGVPDEYVRVSVVPTEKFVEDAADASVHRKLLHDTYVHVELWVPGAGLVAEIAAKEKAEADAKAAEAAAKAEKKSDDES